MLRPSRQVNRFMSIEGNMNYENKQLGASLRSPWKTVQLDGEPESLSLCACVCVSVSITLFLNIGFSISMPVCMCLNVFLSHNLYRLFFRFMSLGLFYIHIILCIWPAGTVR